MGSSRRDLTVARPSRETPLAEFSVRAESMVVGVDRLDYPKGILERLEAIEHLTENNPWYRELLTMVQ